MEEIDAETLVAFADANGLKIMGHRDPRKWAEALNKNNGMCPCGKECPCDDCTCKFYEKDESMTTEEPEKATEPGIVIKNEEIANAIDAMETAKEMLSNMSDDPDEAASTAAEAAEIIKKDAEKHTCGKCGSYMEGLQRKLTWLSAECAKDPMSCVLERDATVSRIETMQGVFVEVDKSIDVPEEEQKESQETKENLDSHWVDPFKDAVYSEFHGCVGKTFNEDLTDVPMGDRMCVASKVCSKAKPTKEDAMKSCMEANKK